MVSSAGAAVFDGDSGGLDSALLEARRFLGFEGGGGKVEKVVPVAAGWEGTAASTGEIGAATVSGDVVEVDTF